MIFTKQFLLDYRTKSGSWTARQFSAIGVSWPPLKGWKKKVIGTEITDKQAKNFIKGKEIFASAKAAKRNAKIVQPNLI